LPQPASVSYVTDWPNQLSLAFGAIVFRLRLQLIWRLHFIRGSQMTEPDPGQIKTHDFSANG